MTRIGIDRNSANYDRNYAAGSAARFVGVPAATREETRVTLRVAVVLFAGRKRKARDDSSSFPARTAMKSAVEKEREDKS